MLPEKVNKYECGIVNLDSCVITRNHWVCQYKNNKVIILTVVKKFDKSLKEQVNCFRKVILQKINCVKKQIKNLFYINRCKIKYEWPEVY